MKHTKQEVLEIFGFLRSMKDDLSDLMGMQVSELWEELKEEYNPSGKDTVNWDYYADEINNICMEDGMPRLFMED